MLRSRADSRKWEGREGYGSPHAPKPQYRFFHTITRSPRCVTSVFHSDLSRSSAQLSTTPILRRNLPFLDQAVPLEHPGSPRTPSERLSNSSGFLSALFDAHFASFVLAVLACELPSAAATGEVPCYISSFQLTEVAKDAAFLLPQLCVWLVAAFHYVTFLSWLRRLFPDSPFGHPAKTLQSHSGPTASQSSIA